jgi:predicted SAM-dependent methyltransferase
MIKLHLGCGDKHIDGYVNIDIRYLPGVDEVNNVARLRNYKNDSVSVIYASHVLEHFTRWQYKDVLKRWFDLLEPNGILRIGVPDFEAIANYYLKTKDLRIVSGMLYGGQDYDENNHFWPYDFNTLQSELIQIGFKQVERYDWKSTEHSHIDDYTQSYLPHLDKENGTLLSLNIEAIK